MWTAETMMMDLDDSGPDTRGHESSDSVLDAAIRSVLAGDRDAFEIVMARTERRVASVAWRVLGNAEDVREAVQETYLRVFRHIDQYDQIRQFDAWLYRIAVNVCRDLDRRRRKRSSRHAELGDFLASPDHDRPDEVHARQEEMTRLERAVDALPTKQRLALILREIEGYSTEEVARILGCRTGTVRVQIASARAKIRNLLGRGNKESRDEL